MQPNLTGIPETMLWTLHNRAAEARRGDTYLPDPDCVRIYDAIDYDFARSFGQPDDSHPMRSRIFDDALRPWLAAHPGGMVVELAAGLEMQFQRCDDGRVRWLCVDLPEAIATRERFLPATDRCRHVALGALDLRWMDEVDPSRGVFVSAQGLLMYFQEHEALGLIRAIGERFPGAELMFDAIPRWFSKKTLAGFAKTPHYVAPPMPWGINQDELPAAARRWSPAVSQVEVQPYGLARFPRSLLLKACASLPVLRGLPPCVVRLRF